MYVRFPLSLRNVEDLLHERGIEIKPVDDAFHQKPTHCLENRCDRWRQWKAFTKPVMAMVKACLRAIKEDCKTETDEYTDEDSDRQIFGLWRNLSRHRPIGQIIWHF